MEPSWLQYFGHPLLFNLVALNRFSNSGHNSYPALETYDGRIAVPGLLPSPTSTQNSLAKSSISVSTMAERPEMPSFERPLSPPNSQQQSSSVDALPLPIIEITEPQSPGLAPVTGMGISNGVGVFHMSSPALLDTVMNLRSDVVAKLVEFRNDSRDLCDQHVHFQNAMHRLNEGIITLFGQLSSQNLHGELQLLQGLWAEVKQASTILNERGEQLQHTSKDLSNREGRLRRKESSLYKRISQAQNSQPLNEPVTDENADANHSSSSSNLSDSATSQPSVVREYYDKVAYADSLRENFLRFRENNYYERRRRDRLRSRHQQVETPESEFLRMYFQERSAMIEEFNVALAAARQLRDECQRKGHLVDALEIPPLSEAETFDAGLLIPQAIVERSLSEKQTSKRQNEVDALLVGDVDPKRRVAQWLEKLSHSEKVELSDNSPTLPRKVDAQTNDSPTCLLAGHEIQPPKFRRDRSVSQPSPSNPTNLRQPWKGTPLQLSTDLSFDLDQSRPKSAPAAPIFLLIHELKNCFT